MDIFWIGRVILLGILIKLTQLIVKHRRNIYISIVTAPRDFFVLYVFIKVWLHSHYCKWTNQTAAKYFDSSMKKWKDDKPCFFFEDEIWTYKKVQEESYKIAKYFKSRGYKKGDAVGLFMESRPDYICVWLGLSRIGVITSLLNYNLRLESLEHCVKISHCKGIIFGTEFTYAIEEVLKNDGFKNVQLFSMDDRKDTKQRISSFQQDPEKCTDLTKALSALQTEPIESYKQYNDKSANCSDLILYIFTSGTTGMPKAVKVTHLRVFMFSGGYFPFEMNPSRDILLTPTPLYHVQGGVVGVSCALFHGVPQVIIRKFSASQFWKQCIKYEVTMVQYMGEIIRYLYNQPESPEDRLHKVKFFMGSGVNTAVWGKFTKRFNIQKIKEMYGSTEGTSNIINVEGHEGAIGYLPVWAYSVLPIFLARFDQLTGELIRHPKTGLLKHAQIGEIGEIMSTISTRDPTREFNGYTDNEATNKKITRDVKVIGDTWFRSGDIATRDEYGYFYFKDRMGDTFKWKGENVSTAEVEQVVARATNFKGNTVYGVLIPHTDGRCGMVAISDPEGELDLVKLAEEVTRHLASFARPLFVRVVKTEIQMTGSYKLQKIHLQKEGIDIHKINDKIYFLKANKYVPLDEELYNQISSGKIRL